MLTYKNGHISGHIVPIIKLIKINLHNLSHFDTFWESPAEILSGTTENSFNCLFKMREFKAERIYNFRGARI